MYLLVTKPGSIQKIAPIFEGLFKDHIKADLDGTIFAYDYCARLTCAMPSDFQGPPNRNIISQIVQKCTFPVYSNNTLRLELFTSSTPQLHET